MMMRQQTAKKQQQLKEKQQQPGVYAAAAALSEYDRYLLCHRVGSPLTPTISTLPLLLPITLTHQILCYFLLYFQMK